MAWRRSWRRNWRRGIRRWWWRALPRGATRNPRRTGPEIVSRAVDVERRELPGDVPLGGIVHLAALYGHGPEATTAELAEDATPGAESSSLGRKQHGVAQTG